MDQAFNIVELFFSAAGKYPGKTAIIYKETAITYFDFAQQVKDTAQHLLARGINKGDRVMVFVPMSPDLYRIVLALFYIGATAVFIDEWVSKERLEACCAVAQCKAFIGTAKVRILALFSGALRKMPLKIGTAYKPIKDQIHPVTETAAGDTALITFTTGSSGTPKAAKRTHGFLFEQFKALAETIHPDPEDIDMPMLPVVLLLNLGVGSTSVITPFNAGKPRSLKPEKIANLIDRHQVNRIIASPFFIKTLAGYTITSARRLPGLKKIFTGGAPVFPAEAALYQKAFPHVYIEVVYGSTEAEPISAINAKELQDSGARLTAGLDTGIPYKGTMVKIIPVVPTPVVCRDEDELDSLALEEGAIGEIIVSGKHVLDAYYNNEAALQRNKIFINNTCWHRTGDSGYLKDGRLYLTGRCDTLIHRKGQLLAPFIYESYLQALDGVSMATILLVNNLLVAVAELHAAADKEKVRKSINNISLDLDKILILKKIPRDPRHYSKIDYTKLRAMVSDAL